MKESSSGWIRYGMYLFVSLFVVGLLLPALSSGQGAEGTVYVHVFDGKSRQAIVGAGVILDHTPKVYYTDEKGVAIITGVVEGFHTITVFKDGYETVYTNFTLKENVTYVNIPMDPASPPSTGVIKGQVFLESLVGGHITAGDAIIGFESPSVAPIGEIIDVTDTSDPYTGEFVVEVPAGTYYLWCWAYSHHVEHSGPITVTAGNVTYHDFYLEYVDMSNSGLAGNVTNADTGAPIAGATVVAYNEDTGDVLYTLTDSDGFYFFTGPWAGNYIVVAMAPGYNPGSGTGVVSWGHVTYVDIVLKPNGTGQDICSALWGFVFGDGIPLNTAQVFTDFGVVVYTDLFGIDGLYYIPCFPTDGSHVVGAWAPGYYPAFSDITVPPATIMRHDFYLQSGNYSGKESLVVGEVLYTGTTNPVNGANIYFASPTTGYGGVFSCPSTSNLFYFAVVTPGPDYLITPTKSGYTYTGFTVDGGPVNSPGTTFTVPSASLVTVDLYMMREGENKTCLWGYVYYLTLGGTPVPGVPVKLLMPPLGPIDITNTVGMYYFSVTPGTYSATPLVVLPGGVISYDYATSSYGSSVWSGTISPGECRRVDFILRYHDDPDKKYGSIAGQVIDLSTGNPVDNFEVKVHTSSAGPYTMMSGSIASGTGYFSFPGLTPTSVTWTADGGATSFIYTLDHVEYFTITPSTVGAPTTSPTLPITFTLNGNTVVWINIYINKTDLNNKAIIWGYLYDPVLYPMTGESIKIINPAGGGTDVTDSSGKYLFYVTPGAYTVTPILIGGGTIIYYDFNTGSSGMAPWSDTVSAGEVRHVDFYLRKYKPPQNCSAIAGMAYINPSYPLSGVYVKADVPSAPSYGVYGYTDGYGHFEFHPLCHHLGMSWDWVFTADMPGLTLDRIEYHILGSSGITTVHSPSFTFNLPPSSILWVEIYYNKTQPCNGTVFGRIYTLYSYSFADGATVKIYDISAPTTPVGSMVTGSDGLYTFTVPAGTYKIVVTFPGYNTANAEVTIPCHENVYKPFYLIPKPIGPIEPVKIKFIYKGNGTPVAKLGVNIVGIGNFVTDENGTINPKIYAKGNYSIHIPGFVPSTPDSIASFVVVISTDDDDEELALNPDGTLHLKPGHHYTTQVVLTEPVAAPSKEEKKGKGYYSGSTVAGAVIASLIVGSVAGFLLRGRPGEGYMGE